MSTQLTTIKKLNEVVNSVITAEAIEGFEKAFLIAEAAASLKESLNGDYMKPIMALQGNKLGFKTDKDNNGGYDMKVVKDCLIEAVLTGVQPFGNQFNIIAGNCYITKEGFGFLLSNVKGLDYEIAQTLPRINGEKTSAAIVMNIDWTYKGEKRSKQIDFAVRMNSSMGADAVIGKATRKARAWLYNKIKGTEILDGETAEVPHVVIDPEKERVKSMITNASTIEELESIALEVEADEVPLFNAKREELKASK